MDDIRPNDIEFTQFLLPHGRSQTVRIERSQEIAEKARAIITAGFRFECEMLTDYRTISLTISNDERDHAIKVVPNGPQVPEAIDRMVMDFDLDKPHA